jgi:outer membrane immunogenic protein
MIRLRVSIMSAAFYLPFALSAHGGGLADPVVAPAPTAPAIVAPVRGNWTGGYVGAELGYGRASTAAIPGSGTGWVGGLFAGYNHQIGGMVVGGEIGASAARLKFDSGERVRSLARAKLRLGADAGDFMPYATVGWARGSGTGGSGNGPLAGVGIDFAMGGNTVLGAEVLHHRLRNFAGSGERMSVTTAALRISYRF